MMLPLTIAKSPRNPEKGETIHSLMGDRSRQYRLGLMLAVTLTLHNLPEGFAVALSTLQNETLGKTMAFTIAMHNIPGLLK